MKRTFSEQLVGEIVGSCRIEALLHQGRSSAIYRAVKQGETWPVAITVFLLPENLSTQVHGQFMTRFMAEAGKLIAVRHPHLLPLYEYGEQNGLPYITTPYLIDGSLAELLQQQGRCTPMQALGILEQVGAGLEYAHQQGILHRALKPGYILLPREQPVQVAGLGLVNLLERRGLLYDSTPYSHLQTIAGTMLVSHRYLAPECMQGDVGDVRSDVYALGSILFEMLSGPSLFNAGMPSEESVQILPTLHTRYTDISPAVDAVLRQALAWQPTARFQRISELLSAFRYAVQGQAVTTGSSTDGPSAAPIMNSSTANKCGDSPLCSTCALGQAKATGMGAAPSSPIASSSMEPVEMEEDSTASWLKLSGKLNRFHSSRLHIAGKSSNRRYHSSRKLNRRKMLALLMGGTGVAVASLSLSLYGLRSISNGAQVAPAMTNVNMPRTGKGTGINKNVIGSKQQAVNTAQQFINPHDGKESLLIRLPSGVFVAYERACTHVGVLVNYDANQHLLVCPAHGSIFNPTQGGSVVQGPAMQPLPQVAVHLNADGTVSV